MEYYFYVILIFAIVLKLTVYLCWYQVRRSSATRQVRIIMPDGTTQCAVIAARGRTHQSHHRSAEERRNLPQADLLSPYDNQGMVESAVQPRYSDFQNPQGQFQGPPPYANQEWKLPKYEEVVGMPPPYATGEPEMASAVMQGDTNPPTSQSHVQPMALTTNPAEVPIPVLAYSDQQLPYDAPPYSPPMTTVTPRPQPGIAPTSNNVTDVRSPPAYFPSSTGQS